MKFRTIHNSLPHDVIRALVDFYPQFKGRLQVRGTIKVPIVKLYLDARLIAVLPTYYKNNNDRHYEINDVLTIMNQKLRQRNNRSVHEASIFENQANYGIIKQILYYQNGCGYNLITCDSNYIVDTMYDDDALALWNSIK